MEFIETPTLTRLVLKLLPADEYRELQFMLADKPACGESPKGVEAYAKSVSRPRGR